MRGALVCSVSEQTQVPPFPWCSAHRATRGRSASHAKRGGSKCSAAVFRAGHELRLQLHVLLLSVCRCCGRWLQCCLRGGTRDTPPTPPWRGGGPHDSIGQARWHSPLLYHAVSLFHANSQRRNTSQQPQLQSAQQLTSRLWTALLCPCVCSGSGPSCSRYSAQRSKSLFRQELVVFLKRLALGAMCSGLIC